MQRLREAGGIAAALLLAALVALAASPAWAHAMLVDATPADGAALDAAPAEVVLRFNEAVAPVAVRVIDSGGAAIVAVAPPPGETLTIALPAGLAPGSYVVSYRVVSADAHPVGGAVVFTVGSARATPYAAGPDARETAWRAAAIVVRFLRDAALLFAAGGALFIVLVLARGDPAASRLAPALRIGAALAALLSLAAIGAVGGLATLAPSPLAGAPWRFGLATTAAWSGLATAAGAALVAAALPARTMPARALAVAGALLATGGPALTGHSAAAGPAAQLLQALHVAAAALWLGALWPLLVLVRAGDAGAAEAARRHAARATLAVAVLVAAGAWLALSHAGGVVELARSPYGAVLALKLAALAALLGLGALIRWRLAPRLGHRKGGRRALVVTLRADLALAALALVATALLAHTPPPHDAARHDHPHDPGLARDLSRGRGVVVAISGERSMVVDVDPGRAGRNTITLAFSAAGTAFVPREVRVELAQPDAGIEPIARAAAPTGDGRFALAGPELALPGAWSVRVEALIDDFEKAIFETRVVVR